MGSSKKTERAERTRLQILDAAADAFAEQGLRGATIASIGRRAGVTKPTVYAHFSGKEELFQAVANDAKHLAWQFEWPRYDKELGFETHLLAILDEPFSHILDPARISLYRVIMSELCLRCDEVPEHRGDKARNLAKWIKTIPDFQQIAERRLFLMSEMFFSMLFGHLFFPVMFGMNEAPSRRRRRKELRDMIEFLGQALQKEAATARKGRTR